MAGKKQQAPKPIEEDEESEEGWDNVAEVDADSAEQGGGRMRDWRDVEKYREMRELRRLVGDEFDFTDVLGEIPIRTPGSPRPGKPAAKAAPVPPQKAPPAASPKLKAKPAAAPAPPPPPPKKAVAKPAPKKPPAKPAKKPVAKPKAKPAKAKKK